MDGFVFAYMLFGPVVAIPMGLQYMAWQDMLLQGMAVQAAWFLLVHFVLESVGYPKEHRRAIVEKFAAVTNKKVADVQKNTERIESMFLRRFGHSGYYLSLIFFSFALGVTWASAIAFALRLRTSVSALFIMLGSLLAFGFWFSTFQFPMTEFAKDVSFVLAVGLSISLLFYGQLREKHILTRIRERLHRRKAIAL